MDETPHRQLIEVPHSTPPGSKPWSAALGRLLTEGTDSAGAQRKIALSPNLRSEASRILPNLEAALSAESDVEAREMALMELLMRNAPGFGVTAKSDAEWSYLFEDYLTILGAFPIGAITDAFARWKRCEMYPNEPGRHAFYPKTPELFYLANRYMTEIRMAYYRAKKALEFVEERGIEWTAERRREERQKAIEAEYLKPDGSLNVEFAMRKVPGENRPQQTPHQMAEALRSRPVDDVI